MEKIMRLSMKLALSAGASFATAGFAFAGNSSTFNPAPQNNIYISGEIGYGSLDTPSNDLPEDVSYSSGDAAASANIGFTHLVYRNINNLLLGIEFGYDYNGQSKYTAGSGDDSISMEVISSDFHLLASATYLLSNGINFFAKAGPAYVKQELDFSSDDNEQTEDTSKSQCEPMIAAGLGYQFKNFNFYFQYNHIFGKDAQNWTDLINPDDGTFAHIVSVNTYKAGVAINIAV